MPPQSQSSDPVPTELHDNLWNTWLASQRANQNLHTRALHKALDIPEHPPGVNSTKITTGIGVLGAALLAAGPIAGFSLALLWPSHDDQQQLPSAPLKSEQGEYEIRFFDSEGHALPLPWHIPTDTDTSDTDG